MKKRHALCTLFNSIYADKGLVLYESLCKVTNDFTLYVLAMDDKCFDVLTDLNYQHLVPVRLQDFEDDDLRVAKSNRPFGQYCWTCSSSFIKYVLDTYTPDFCTYIDADMCFYNDPYVLVEELEQSQKDVLLVGHRFSWYDKKKEKKVGHFCVECNTFKNNKESYDLLQSWIEQCLEDCSAKADGRHWGDQMYISDWTKKYANVVESSNYGAGVAPWNISQYSMFEEYDKLVVKHKKNKFPLLFYHFEGITYQSENIVDIHVYSYWGIDSKFVERLYVPYLNSIQKAKHLLKKYSINTVITSHPALEEQKKESLKEKFNRRIRMIMKLELSELLFHGLPYNLFKDRNIVKLTDNL